MLVLSRNVGERICIGNDVELVVIDIRGGRVKLGFAAPRELSIDRGEVRARDRLKAGGQKRVASERGEQIPPMPSVGLGSGAARSTSSGQAA